MKKRLLSMVVIGLLALVCTMAAAAAQPDANPQDMAMAIAYYTNQYRISQGLPELVYRTDFQQAADIRAQEITVKFSHERPNGNLCWEGLMDYNWFAGENCIGDPWSAMGIVESWIDSDGHRANILSTEATGIAVGVAYAKNTVYAVQSFIRERPLPAGFQPAPAPSIALTGGQFCFGVVDEDGRDVEGAAVTVKNSMGQTISSTTDWTGGTVDRLLVTDGANTLTASKEGYVSDSYTLSVGFLQQFHNHALVLKKIPVATPSPTVAPTPSPTPTVAPTPSPAPTAAPTAPPAPTGTPTAVPTTAPTAVPTAAPTAAPTPKPTAAPTSQPTAAPTLAPTTVPTAAPTPAPTAAPAESGVEAFVTRLYKVCLNRQPDAGGKASWVGRLKSGQITGSEAAKGFVFSSEFISKGYSNADYVKQLYRAFMGREYDQGGLSTWAGQLNAGVSRETVFNGFARSTEFLRICNNYGIRQDNVTAFVTRLYDVCLDRQPDESGLMDWSGKLWNRSSSGTSIAKGFVFSNEFAGRGFSNTDYVKQLYRAFMGREYDQDGLNDWVAKLNAGASRESVFNGFAGSTEFGGICNSYGIVSG